MAGFLDHSTNTIILDAVLTTRGRELLSRFDGSFQITKFALTDDEIQYNLVRQYGRIIGKEYIEKLTPIVEANTNAAAVCKYHLIGTADQHKTALPYLKANGDNYTHATKTLTMTTSAQGQATDLNIMQAMEQESATVSDDLRDSVFQVKMRHDQLRIRGQTPTVDSEGIASYRILAGGSTRQGGGRAVITLRLSPALADPSRYGRDDGTGVSRDGNTSEARGYVKIHGMQSGANLNALVVVTKV